jgi:hypothetical protein
MLTAVTVIAVPQVQQVQQVAVAEAVVEDMDPLGHMLVTVRALLELEAQAVQEELLFMLSKGR